MSIEIVSTVILAATATPPAGAYDLTDLATAKDELQISASDVTSDSFLQRAISQASTVISNYCNRVFPVETLQDLCLIERDIDVWQMAPGGVNPLQLSRWPILPNNAVASFTGDLTSGSATVDNISSMTGLIAGGAISGDGITAGTTIQSLGTNSLAMTNEATVSGTGIALSTGLSVVQNVASLPSGPANVQPLVLGTDFSVDAAKGALIRLNPYAGSAMNWEAVPTTVQYAAGYAPIPLDLVDACLRLVTARYLARGRDPMLMSQDAQGLGPQRWWVGTAPGQSGALSPEIQALVEQYRVPAVA